MSALQKDLSLLHGVGLAVSTIIGSGLLGLPGLALEVGGSETAALGWIVTALMSLPLVYLFMRLALRVQDAGGIARYAEISFGAWAHVAVTVILVFTFALCIPIGTYMGSAYIQKIFGLPADAAFWIAVGILLISTVVNCIGVRQSAWINNLAVLALIALILLLVGSNMHLIPLGMDVFRDAGRHASALPVSRLWAVCAILFWAFLGWENLSFSSEEVKGSERTIKLIYLFGFVVVTFLYGALAVVSVGSNAAGMKIVGVTGLLALVDGRPTATFAHALILLIVLANVNAWVFAASRLLYSAGRARILPSRLGDLANNGMPQRSLTTLFVLYLCFVTAIHSTLIPLATGLAIANQNFALLYLTSVICFFRLNRGMTDRIVAVLALLSCTFLLVGFGWWLLLPLGLAALGYLIYRRGRVAGDVEAA